VNKSRFSEPEDIVRIALQYQPWIYDKGISRLVRHLGLTLELGLLSIMLD